MSTLSPKGTGVITETTGAAHARILGVGGYRPERVVPNSEVIDKIDSSDEWIRERSGIISRRFAAPDETVVDMSEHATREALAMAGLEAGQIDAVIVATVTHPYQTPGAAPILADRLGIQGAAFDISAACAGYCHGIALANDMVRGGSAQHVLVVGVEKLSDFTDPYDRGTAFIFGDGAGAAIVGPSDTPAIGPTVWGSGRVPVEDHLPARQLDRDTREEDRLPRDHHGWTVGFPLGGLGHGPCRPEGARRRGRPHRGPRRLHPPPGQHAHHRRDDQAAQAA